MHKKQQNLVYPSCNSNKCDITFKSSHIFSRLLFMLNKDGIFMFSYGSYMSAAWSTGSDGYWFPMEVAQPSSLSLRIQ